MQKSISPRDLELISAYLDQQLKEADRKHFEARLSQDSALVEALEDLRQTRLLLRSLKRVHVPRNFTLSPQVAEKRLPMRVYPALGFMSALASILLIVVLVGDWLGVTTLRMTEPSVSQKYPTEYLLQAEVPPQGASLETLEPAQVQLEAAEEENIVVEITKEVEIVETTVVEGGEVREMEWLTPTLEVGEVLTMKAVSEAVDEKQPTVAAIGISPEESPTAVVETPTPGEEAMVQSGEVVVTTPEQLKESPFLRDVAITEEEPKQEPSMFREALQPKLLLEFLKIFLLVVAIFTGSLAFIQWRKSRS